MSAVMQPKSTELRFPATDKCQRQMTLEVSKGGFFYLSMYPPGSEFRSIAHAVAPIERVTLFPKFPAIFVWDVHFRLSESEAAEIERAFGPLGLSVDRMERP